MPAWALPKWCAVQTCFRPRHGSCICTACWARRHRGFAHCPLLLAPDGRRLSKRDGDQSLENLREKYTAQEIVGKLAYTYGLQPEPAPRTPESLIKDFSWAKVPKQDVCLPEDLF